MVLCFEHFVSCSLYTFTDSIFLVPGDFLEFGKKEKEKKLPARIWKKIQNLGKIINSKHSIQKVNQNKILSLIFHL